MTFIAYVGFLMCISHLALDEFCHLKQGTIFCSEAYTDPLSFNGNSIYIAEGMFWPVVNSLLKAFFLHFFSLAVFIFFLSKGSDVIPVAAVIEFSLVGTSLKSN